MGNWDMAFTHISQDQQQGQFSVFIILQTFCQTSFRNTTSALDDLKSWMDV